MRLLTIFLLLLPATIFCQSNEFLSFDSESIELGKVKKGEKVEGEFTFTNISDEDVIFDLVSTCECTEAKWPSTAVKPGEKGSISFVFDSSKKDDEEDLSIDVFLKNLDKKGNPAVIFLNYSFEY